MKIQIHETEKHVISVNSRHTKGGNYASLHDTSVRNYLPYSNFAQRKKDFNHFPINGVPRGQKPFVYAILKALNLDMIIAKLNYKIRPSNYRGGT